MRHSFTDTPMQRFWPVRSSALLVALLAAVLLLPGRTPAQSCIGDCDGSGLVTVEELVRGVDIALDNLEPSACMAWGANGEGEVLINELIAAVNHALNGCALVGTPTATPSLSATAESTATPTWTITSTATETATLSPTSTATLTPSPAPTPTATLSGGAISIADAVARDAQGVAVRLGQQVTTEGVVTVTAGVFARGKLKIFIQSAGFGIMVYHQTSANVEAFQAGELLRATGVIRQADPTGGGNPAQGTVLIDITNGAASILSTGNPLPAPVTVTLSQLVTNGVAFTGTLVHVASIHKVAGDWPQVGDKSTEVTVGDDSGATLPLRFQPVTIIPQLTAKLQAIGTGPFAATAIVVQEDLDTNGTLLSGFQLWVRGADDIDAPAQ